jgi:hypothetical protein
VNASHATAALIVTALFHGSVLAESDTSIKGSVLVFPALEVRWSADGNVVQDTFVEITNHYAGGPVDLQMYFIQGDPPLAADPTTGEGAHPGWNWYDNRAALTQTQPVYWSIRTGQPLGVAPWTILDPGPPPGRPAMDGSNDRVLRGCLYVWALDPQTLEAIRWDHLGGGAVTVDYRDGMAWEYDPIAFQVVDPDIAHGDPLDPQGVLNFDNAQLAAPPESLLLKFQAINSVAFSDPSEFVRCDGDLSLLPMFKDLRQDSTGPITTSARVTIWNMNEIVFSGTNRCVTFWDQTLLSQYEAPVNWHVDVLQTDHGVARIDGLHHVSCPESTDAAMLGVVSRHVTFFSDIITYSRTGSNLVGVGSESAQVFYDTIDPPPPNDRTRTASRQTREGGSDPSNRAGLSVEGSLLVFPNIEIQWDNEGDGVRQNAYIELANDSSESVDVRLYFVNGDRPLPEDFSSGERAHLGWNHLTTEITLTPHQPTFWSVLTGAPAEVPPWTDLDPGPPEGRPNPDGTATRVLRGFLYAWAINDEGDEIRHDHLSGRVTTISYATNTGWEHDAYAFRVADPAVAPGEPTGTPGTLHLDGTEFASSFDQLLLNFQAVGSDALSGPGRIVESDTDLALLPASVDLTSATERPLTTRATFNVYNENEIKFSGTHRCVTGWDGTLLSDYGAPNTFRVEVLQTDQAWARIDGVASVECTESQDAALLGVASRRLAFEEDFADDATGSSLAGQGSQSAIVRAGPYTECLIDQYQPLSPVYMAGFSQTDLAQSFKPARGNIGGAGIFLQPDVGESDVVTIGLWDALPNAGGTLLAEGTNVGTEGTWVDVEWEPVPVTPGTTYYLVFSGNETLGIAGDSSDPYPDGHVFANPGYQPFPNFDYTFRTCWVPEGGFKQPQTLACGSFLFFSNLNSDLLPWQRFDDFICAETGDINHISFWGAMFDVANNVWCDELTNLAGVEINLYTWEPGGDCPWEPGELLCSNFIPAEDLFPVEVCQYDLNVTAFRLSADLPEPCFQEQGEHYAIRIAAQLDDSAGDCVFAWASTVGTLGSTAYSRPGEVGCMLNTSDAAFIMLTEPMTIPGDLNGDGVVNVFDLLDLLAVWGPCPDPPDPCPADLNGDGVVNVFDLLILLGAWG